MGMTLRQAWFINGTLYNSEVWCSFSDRDIEVLNVLDRKILRLITGAHRKTPSEMLYLELGVTPIRHIVMARRLMFYHYILNEDPKSLIHRFYQSQCKNPVRGLHLKKILKY